VTRISDYTDAGTETVNLRSLSLEDALVEIGKTPELWLTEPPSLIRLWFFFMGGCTLGCTAEMKRS